MTTTGVPDAVSVKSAVSAVVAGQRRLLPAALLTVVLNETFVLADEPPGAAGLPGLKLLPVRLLL
ncbi:hypothetical protein ACRYCC_35730 [Actinomadura scrupuli]|uniref:hypothetical protein n=1 Tax=Actinomadura scrupuli TaxID=559629 RepID=UPI003D954B76